MKSNEHQAAIWRAVTLRGWQALRQPLVATAFGLLVGAIVILACGQSPIEVYKEMFQKSFFQPYYLFSTLTRRRPSSSAPWPPVCPGGPAISTWAWRARWSPVRWWPPWWRCSCRARRCWWRSWPGIAGMAAGALYALLPSVLVWKFNVSMVITTLMLNYVANYIASYFVTYPLKDTSGDGLALQTPEIDELMRLPRLSSTSTFNAGFIIAVLVVVFMVFVTRKTVFGYESKMGGYNPSFARYGGTKQVRVMLVTMALAGAIASLAGSAEVFGLKYRYADNMLSSTSYAWTGLQAALIAGLDPVGMFFVSIFLSGLQIGGSAIQRSLGIPLEIATIIQCCITLFVSVKVVIRVVKKPKAAKEGGTQA